jgi:carbohydrate binding protein with CBM6 domain
MKTRAGEWLKYTINIPTSGSYGFQARVASLGNGGTFHVEVDGVNATGAISVPNTNGWQTWVTIPVPSISFAAGTRVIRIVLDTVGPSGGVGNFNWFSLSTSSSTTPPPPDPTPPPPSPAYGGTPAPLPGLFEAENYDKGGQNVAYFDTTALNAGNVYRTQEDVDLEQTTDTGGGYNVMKTRAGEWLQYTVNVTNAGTYTFEARVASMGGGGTFHVEVDRVNVTGSLQVLNTNGWQNWDFVSKPGIALTAGTHVIRIHFETVGPSGGVGNYNWFRFR